MEKLYENPIRPKLISAFTYVDFIDKYENRVGTDLEHLRFGQAFICYTCKSLSVTDPELFYSTNDDKSHQIINEFYIQD